MSRNLYKKDFPIFSRQPNLAYLDSAATALKPRVVITAMTEYLEKYPASVHRGVYPLAEKATATYEAARAATAKFIGATNASEIVFTKNTTEAINLVAYGIAQHLTPKSNVVTTIAEHHSNFVPWQQLAKQHDAQFRVVEVTGQGKIDLAVFSRSVTRKTAVVAISAVSNVLGTINPITAMVKIARKNNPNAIVIVDAAQAVAHMPIDVARWGADFVAFSAHKLYGPTGLGVLWGTTAALEKLPPFLFGGEMIERVQRNETTFATAPRKFEAGTPPIAEVIAFHSALDYVQKIGLTKIRTHEEHITQVAITTLKEEFGNAVQILGPEDATDRAGLIAFTFRDYHPHDVAQILGEEGVCIRAGHHCAAPLHAHLNLTASCRVSFGIFNDEKDIARFMAGLKKVDQILGQ